MPVQVIQRDLPRPHDINVTILRTPSEMVNATDMQRAEELIKLEMVTMLHYDALENPVPPPAVPLRKQSSLAQLAAYLDAAPYEDFDDEQLSDARQLLRAEVETVRVGMGHELSLESYAQVWEECLGQVLFMPGYNRYTRASLASKKDRLESFEKQLEQNRKHMAREAKRCAKIEKKLKVLTGGYQARAKALSKQLVETYEQVDQQQIGLSTFRFLAGQEDQAMIRRLEVMC